MSTATPTPRPAALLMSFSTSAGAVVEVSAVDRSSAPYRWTCSAGHDGGRAYASLPFCRDDAKAHAGECLGVAPDPAVVEKVRVALGYRAGWKPNRHLGEIATRLTVWSQVELNEIFERVGGTVTTREVERSTSDGSSTWMATEITLTVVVPGVGPVEVVTDIEDDPEHGYRTDVPVVAVARYRAAAAHCRALAADGDFDGCLPVQDEMAMCRCQLERAGRLDLIGAA
ncbi:MULTISPECIES: hypothetical protein [Streptomyces]|uniref:Uncharacterized protein n=1 Tax=Streptomyces dengpaensis TaxID=2049881 RepID=A0ABM6SYZ6_9ACTN|nr:MULTISPECIES: hypothetical protein [Streptomyces]AVH59972.1 hypothetical protein C4B68_34035 [Streptomyces dengpaensis]PIB09609.1 hypothetical protein B1C81_10710 [Streptomyces sp. HG99]